MIFKIIVVLFIIIIAIPNDDLPRLINRCAIMSLNNSLYFDVEYYIDEIIFENAFIELLTLNIKEMKTIEVEKVLFSYFYNEDICEQNTGNMVYLAVNFRKCSFERSYNLKMEI